MTDNASANIDSDNSRTTAKVIVCVLGCIVILWTGYLWTRITLEEAIRKAFGRVTGIPLQYIPEARRVSLEQYPHHGLLGMTVDEMKAEVKKDTPPPMNWQIWPNYVRAFAEVGDFEMLQEFIVTDGRISAIRWSSHHPKNVMTERYEWIDGNGRYHPELTVPKLFGAPGEL